MERKIIYFGEASLLRDFVFAADDGLVTTFAIIASSTGARFSPSVAIALGLANILADGFSLASGIYLGVKSELEFSKKNKSIAKIEGAPIHHAIISFVSFSLFGFIPLVPFLFNLNPKFLLSCIFIGVALFIIGICKAIFTKKNILSSGIEMLLIGGIAAFIAYSIGFLVDKYLV